MSHDLDFIQDLLALEDLTGGIASMNVLVESDDVTSPGTLEWMLELEQRVNESGLSFVGNTNSLADLVMQSNEGRIPQDPQMTKQLLEQIPPLMRTNLVTNDFTAANVIINLREVPMDDYKMLQAKLMEYTQDRPETVETRVTGLSVVAIKVSHALTSGREKMTVIGIAFIFGALLLLFRLRVIRAVIAIVPIALITGWSSAVMYLMGIKYTPLTATLGALIIGIGVEFTILLMMRYYEERDKGEDPRGAMTTAITRIGRAIIASGLTVIGGFGALLIARDFRILTDFGTVTMINVFFALVSTLVVLPPLIVLVDRWRGRMSLSRQSSPDDLFGEGMERKEEESHAFQINGAG